MSGSFGHVFCYSINFLSKLGFSTVFKAILDDLLSIDSACKSNKNASFLTFIPVVIF